MSQTFQGCSAKSELMQAILANPDYKDVGAAAEHAFDVILWDDKLWDFYVGLMRNAALERPISAQAEADDDAEADHGSRQILTDEERAAILSHRWLKPKQDWPSVVDKDFNFGRDDPQGLGCPIGSHIRRSNPRDTPNPDNTAQYELNNRHRIIRRGRPYGVQGAQRPDGTHFMCLNANIERQYEFIQRTWLNARDFQGLVQQPDPVAAPHSTGDRFVIPHTSNLTALKYPEADKANGAPTNDPINSFTRLVGGGYYFLPSRAALAYLSHPNRLGADNAKDAP